MPINFIAEQPESKNGLLSVVRLTIPYTGEVLNIGVVLQDMTTNEIRIQTIDDFSKLEKCFQIKDAENIEYALEILQKRQINESKIYTGQIAPSLIITEPSRYIISSQTIEQELENIFKAKVSLSKHIKPTRNLHPYSKTTLITKIQQEIKQKQWGKTIKTRKHIATEFGEDKEISLVSFAGENPIVAAQLVSLYVDFWATFQNALLLRYLKQPTITDKIIYMPPVGGVVGFADKLRFVKEQAEKEQFTLIDSIDSNEILGIMKQKADQALLIA